MNTRKPVFAPAGGPPGAPIQWGEEVTNNTITPGFGYLGSDDVKEDLQYFYHSDHLGSTSYITNAKGDITQFIAYMPFGETLAEQHSNWDSPYKFNAKEMDVETGLYYYGARYYDPKVSVWLGVDPLAEKYPNMGGYLYCFNNPTKFIDPDGENPILGALTEYASIIGSQMLFEGKGFVDANKSLTWRDGINIGISAGMGAATGALDGGITKFAKWAANPKNQKIIVKLLEVGVEALENALKDYVDDGSVDIKGLLVSTLTDVGLGHLLQTDKLGKVADEFLDNAKVATHKAEDLAKRTTPNKKLIKNAQDEAKSNKQGYATFKGLETTVKAGIEVTSKGIENKVTQTKNETE